MDEVVSTEYWIYRTMTHTYGQQEIVAKLATLSGREENKVYYGEGAEKVYFRSPQQKEPYNVDLKLTFMVNPKHKTVDNYVTYTGFSLFSKRLVELVREFGVKFETFRVVMIDKEGNELPDMEYYAFHLLEPNWDVVDLEASGWDEEMLKAKQLVFKENIDYKPVMAVLDYLFLTVMRDDLKQEINKRGYTGFGFLHPKKYREGIVPYED